MAEDVREVDIGLGITILPPLAVPDDATVLEFELQRATTQDVTLWSTAATQVEAQIQLSRDGNPFALFCGFTAAGGLHLRADGSEAAVSSMSTDLPAGQQRQLRARLRVEGQGLRTRARMRAV